MTNQSIGTGGAGDQSPSLHGYKFAVLVVESPRAADAYENRSEMAALSLVGQLDAIPVDGRSALDRRHFKHTLREGVLQFVQGIRKPYILCLPYRRAWGQTWHRVVKRGARAAAETLWGEDDLPFLAMVGSEGSPVWSQTAIGYATLYHNLKGGSIDRRCSVSDEDRESSRRLRLGSCHCCARLVQGRIP